MESTRYLYKVSRKINPMDDSSPHYTGMIVCSINSDEAIRYHPNRYHYADIDNNCWNFQLENGILLSSHQKDRLMELWFAGDISDFIYRLCDQVDTNWINISELSQLDVTCLGTAAPYLETGVITPIYD